MTETSQPSPTRSLLEPIPYWKPTARNIFSSGELPTDFSINLGVAPCNHTCLFCPQSVKKPSRAAWLDLGLLEKVANELPETGLFINISSYSETMAAPNLVPAVSLLKRIRPALPIIVATNGSLFRESVIRGLIEAGLDVYQFSFDAPDRESYKILMQVDHFDRAWDNLQRTVDLRNQLGSTMRIITHIMGFEEFREKFEAFRQEWEGKVDQVIWRNVGNWGGDLWGLEENLARAGFSVPEGRVPALRAPCNSIFMHFKLQHDGRYYPCVAAVPDHVPEEELHDVPLLGTAHDITWGEAWRRLSDMRQAHLAGAWDRFSCCRSCNIWSLWPQVWHERAEPAPGETRFHLPDVPHAR